MGLVELVLVVLVVAAIAGGLAISPLLWILLLVALVLFHIGGVRLSQGGTPVAPPKARAAFQPPWRTACLVAVHSPARPPSHCTWKAPLLSGGDSQSARVSSWHLSFAHLASAARLQSVSGWNRPNLRPPGGPASQGTA